MKPLFKKGQTVITSKGNIGVIDEDQHYILDDQCGNVTETVDVYHYAYYNKPNVLINRTIPLVKLGDKVFQINEEKLQLVDNPKELRLIKLFDECFDLIENYYSVNEADKLRDKLKQILL